MSNEPRSRGAHPDDAVLFGAEALGRLAIAQEEAAFLLDRGYPLPMVLRTVGDHHQLDARQRLAIQRATCSEVQRAARLARAIEPARGAEGPIAIDGFNLLITLEVALSGGVLLASADGALRDLAGMRGSYHLVPETEAAIDLLIEAVRAMRAPAVRIWLDAPVSNSGRLRARLLERRAELERPVEVELVPDADPALAGMERVVSSDAAVIDACASWINLAAWIVSRHLPAAWIVRLDRGAPGISAAAARG